MRKIYTLIAGVTLLVSSVAFGLAQVATTTQYNLADGALTTAYTQIFSAASVTKAVKGVAIANSTLKPVQVAIGGAGSEAVQLMVPAGTVTNGTAAPIYYPLVLSQNTRISLRASTGSIGTGFVTMTLFYN
jgi:hypothetical protein